jgi:hypothetical protein
LFMGLDNCAHSMTHISKEWNDLEVKY